MAKGSKKENEQIQEKQMGARKSRDKERRGKWEQGREGAE